MNISEPPPAENGHAGSRAELHLVPRGGTAAVDEWFQQFTDIFQQHRRLVFVTARRICGEELAVDVTQDVFFKLWRAPQQFDAMRGSMRSLLVTMARGTAIDVLRQNTARRAREERVSSDGPWRGRSRWMRIWVSAGQTSCFYGAWSPSLA